MKTLKYLFMTLLIMLSVTAMKAQQRNILQIPDVTVQHGSSQLPVNIENTDEIVGIQFDLTLPDGITVSSEGVMGSRSNGHSVIVNHLSNGVYRVMVYSADNLPLRGQTGVVMYLPVNIPESLAEGSERQPIVTGVVLGKATGENILTETKVGKITIAKLPDLTVKNIVFDKSLTAPGDKLVISWQVENIGQLPTGGGWAEQLSLVSVDNSISKLIATTYYDEALSSGGIISRQAEVALPSLLGIDGPAKVQIRIVPNEKTGEKPSAQGNNTQLGESVCNIQKVLTFSLTPRRIIENECPRINSTVHRSGRWDEAETFNVTATSDSRIAVPSTITIPAGQSGYIFYLSPTDNSVLDSDSIVTITIEGNGYAAVQQQLVIEDNEFPDLALTASKSQLTEGETFQLTVSTSRISTQPIVVTLSSEKPKRFDFTPQIVIPAGQTSVTIDITAKDDETPSLILSNMFTVSAPKHNKAETLVVLNDNDLPVLELTLTPTTVQESAGVVAVAGVLRRTTNTDSRITVKLTDDADGGLYFGNRTLVLEKGVAEVHFNFGPVDNAIVDGDRTYTITAAVWLSSCSCNASGESAGYVTAQLNVLDNDGPALNLTSSLSTVKEGGKTTLIISRNTTDTSTPLTVALSSDYDEGLTYNHTVTIPVGQQSAAVEVTSSSNSVQGDSHTVIFTVQTEGYAKGTCFVMITDQTLPDARISSISAVSASDGSPVESLEVGEKAKLTITVCNDGAAELPAEMPVKIYLRGSSTAIGTIHTNDAITVGASQTVTKTITLPTTVGQHRYYAVVNESNTAQELTYTNNTSADVTITTVSPFAITVSTDKAVYRQGDKVIITGQLTGNSTTDTDIDVYLINEGARQVQTVKTDANGAFTYEWQLYALQSGHFAVGACYPGEGLKTEMATFDVYGLRRNNSDYITCEIGRGETKTGQIEFVNPGNLPLSGVKAEIVSMPDNCEAAVEIPNSISGGSTVQMNYSLKGTEPSAEKKWYEVVVRITTNEGVTQDITLYFYCFSQRAQLVSDVKRLNTTITQGLSRDYPIQIINTGKGESGAITLALPEFVTCEQGTSIPSIAQNDTITVLLHMKTNNKMQLNVPVTGTIGINCSNGNGLTIDYSVEMVSEEKGILKVDVCDEYTYNTAEAPHVANAEVVVRHPSTGAELAKGITGDNGTFSIELPAGYYKVSVSADKHEQYTNYCSVNPGKTETLVVNISYQPITIQWNVEETEVEDVYGIVSTLQYETNVPMPVVKTTLPKSIDGDNMAVGDAVIVNMLLTNVGLVNAEEVVLDLPTGMTEWKFEPLAYTEPFTLGPQQMVTVPVLITRIADETANSRLLKNTIKDAAGNMIPNYANCMAGLGSWYKGRCGKELKTNHAAERMAMKLCAYSATMQFIGDVLSGIFGGGGLGGPGGGGGGGGGGGSTYYGDVKQTFDICDPCDAEMAERYINTLIGHTWLSVFDDAINKAIEEYQKGGKGNYKFVVKNVGGDIVEEGANQIIDHYVENGSTMVGYAIEVYELVKPCEQTEPDPDPNDTNDSRSIKKRSVSKHSWQEKFTEIADTYINQVNAMDSIMLFIYGDRIWYDEMDEGKAAFISYISQLEDGYVPSDAELMAHKPSSVTEEQMRAYVEHVLGESDSSVEELEKHIGTYQQIHEDAVKEGYESMTNRFKEAFEDYQKNFDEMKASSVCASITLQIKQTMTMTRQAFRGSLIVFNGHESLPMKDVKLNLEVFNSKTGQVATAHELQINAESLDGFTGALDFASGWALDANVTGTATVLFIPTKYAAPEEPAEWSFGGTLSYIDPFTGLEVTRELYPVTLTVKPSPELDLTYFMQRDVYGDDPLTLDVVEPMKEAEFALLINNKGNGEATNVRMVTQQPEIVENEKGLKIDFELISGQVNGNDAVLGFGQSIANDFGNIPAHSQTYAQWWLTSTLLGHFTDYKVEANHVTSYGNEDLSLLGDVTIKELIHGFDMPEGSLTGGPKNGRAFLVNEIPDAEDLPDNIYFTNGETASVSMATSATVERTSATTCLLTITPSATGWNYGSLLDPTHGYAELKSIVRQSDGTELGTTRFWQTDRTLLDGKDWLYENRLHFVDNFEGIGSVTYVLTFDPVPETVLEVVSIAPIPEEGDIVEEPINELTIDFNKEIDATTFTSDDITFNVQGVKQDATQINISTTDNKKFKLDMSSMNPALSNGYYTLSVKATDITDAEGFQGKTGKQVGWILFRGGLVQLQTLAWPENSGSVTRKTDDAAGARRLAPANDANSVKYGSVITLVAEAASGYEFSNWTLNGEVVSNDAEYTTTALNDMNFVANFKKKQYAVNVKVNGTGGTTEGTATGIYEHGTEVAITAVPDEDYTLKGWTVNGEAVEGSTNSLTTTVDKPTDIEVSFLQEYYCQSLTLAKGWNWVSSYISEPLELHNLQPYANRIISQTDELINDPELGMVGGITELTAGQGYKIEASSRFTSTFRGHLYDTSTTPINLRKGWNWISYPYKEMAQIDVVGNADEGDFITSQTGFTEYAGGYWAGTLNTLTPGMGYLYKSMTDKQLAFNTSGMPKGRRLLMASVTTASEYGIDIHRYPNTMNITAQLYRDGTELSGNDYTIYAMTGDEIRGISQYVGGYHYLTVYGDEAAEISFLIENNNTGARYMADEKLMFHSDVVGNRKVPFNFNINTVTGINQLDDCSCPMTVYTMEGVLISSEATLKTLTRLPKGIYIVNGQKRYVK